MLWMSLCEHCDHMREVRSGKGSRFLLCMRSQSDPRFAKYPRQPVQMCPGHSERAPLQGPEPPDGGTKT